MFKLSNENIVFLYLRNKQEMILLDKRMRELDKFVNTQAQRVASDRIPNALKDLLNDLAKKIGGGVPDFDDITKKQVGDFYEKTKKVIENNIEIRISIITELETAYSVLSEEHPDLVNKYNELLKDEFI